MHLEISCEDALLDTGGGLKKAGWFFAQEDQPFLLHNVDVLSSIDFGRMIAFHEQRGALATLAVRERKTSRYLLFDEELALCGRRSGSEPEKAEMVRPAPNPQALAFCGIHIISPRLLSKLSEDGIFSIITSYLRLAGEGEKILAFRADEYYWRDLGRTEDLAKAGEDLRQNPQLQPTNG
jgi:NDP-sugar pyrophosphorylase family protein